MAMVEELRTTVAALLQGVGPSVVGVGQRLAVGSGIVVGEDRVLTNAHNLRGDEVTVTFPGGRSATASVVAADVDGDLAVLRVDTGDAAPIEWGDGPEVGAPVFAISNPGGTTTRVTFGLVSATERAFRGPRGSTIRGALEHTAALVPGSSGGPVVDEAGRLLGINTHRLGDGFYLAIPADAALRERVERLGRGEVPAKRRLGIAVASSRVAQRLRTAVGLPEVDGLLVRGVEDDSPAAKAGIREGDLIVGAGDAPVASVDDLHAALDAADGPLELRVLRGTDERTVTVEVT